MNKQNNRILLPRYSNCFVCGNQNPIGLDVTFYYTNGYIETQFTPRQQHAGYQNVVHGGILATLLDECMGWSSIIARNVMCLAADLSIRYKVSAIVGDPLIIRGELVEDKKRLILVKGQIHKPDGTVICTGQGKFVPLSPEKQDEVITYAGWGKALDRVVEQINQTK